MKSQRIAIPADLLAETRSAPAARNREYDLPAEFRTIPIRLVADDRGRTALAEVGERQYQGFDALRAELTSILDDPELAFDRARISVDPRLMCSELNRVMDVLARGHVTGFELAPTEPGDRRLGSAENGNGPMIDDAGQSRRRDCPAHSGCRRPSSVAFNRAALARISSWSFSRSSFRASA